MYSHLMSIVEIRMFWWPVVNISHWWVVCRTSICGLLYEIHFCRLKVIASIIWYLHMVFIRTIEIMQYYLSLVLYSRWNHSGGRGNKSPFWKW